MINFYELLEVSEKASPEVIDKAYRVLAKKYHPDLQQQSDKKQAEGKMKQINEAYEVLSNEQKRKEYDEKLEQERRVKQQQEQRNANVINTQDSERASYSNENVGFRPPPRQQEEDNFNGYVSKEQRKIKKRIEQEYTRKYEEAYDNYLRSLGYTVKERWTWERVKRLAITLIAVIIAIIFIWFFPPTHKILVELYENNPVIKPLVDAIVGVLRNNKF